VKIKTADQFLDNYGIKALLTGASGVGKTTSIKSLADEGFKPILISAESGLLSLAGSNNISIIDISKDENDKPIELKDRASFLMQKVFPFIKEGKHGFDTVFLDSITEVSSCVMAHLGAKYPDPKNNLLKYGENSEIMRKIVKEFRDLKYNVVVVALSTVEKDDVGRRFVVPDVVGKISNELPAMFDEVLNLQIYTDEAGVSKRRFQCHPSDLILCKDRSGKLDLYENLTLGQIFKKIKGGVKKQQAEKQVVENGPRNV
jgi:phage nucleotide-binding protein